MCEIKSVKSCGIVHGITTQHSNSWLTTHMRWKQRLNYRGQSVHFSYKTKDRPGNSNFSVVQYVALITHDNIKQIEDRTLEKSPTQSPTPFVILFTTATLSPALTLSGHQIPAVHGHRSISNVYFLDFLRLKKIIAFSCSQNIPSASGPKKSNQGGLWLTRVSGLRYSLMWTNTKATSWPHFSPHCSMIIYLCETPFVVAPSDRLWEVSEETRWQKQKKKKSWG